ncbi:MAG: type II toxin-antitoxin system HipA family toxin [Pseudomonadales bacterium]
MSDQLDVWVNSKKVGDLLREDHDYSFQYTELSTLDPARDLVSLTMPVRVKRYDTKVLMPPFQIALPEGALLENIRTRFGKMIDVSNDMNLLRMVGNNTIGRVRFSEPGMNPRDLKVTSHSVKEILAYPETEALFADLFEDLAEQSGVSGVQPKLLWSEHGGKASIATPNYILKTSGPEYPLLALNEYICLAVTRFSGLSTPEVSLSETGKLLAVKRFDLTDRKPLAFEEICALMERPTHGKYMGSYEEVVETIRKVPCHPLNQALRDAFKAIALSMMLRNGDAHLKNFGVLYDTVQTKWLAPIYDLVSTTVYIPRDVPALTLDGRKEWPTIDQLKDFGTHACGLRTREVNKCIEEIRSGMRSMHPEMRRLQLQFKSDLSERLIHHFEGLFSV